MTRKFIPTRRKTAAELLAPISTERPAPAFACRTCGTISCTPEQHNPAPRSFDPGAAYLRAVAG